VRHVGLVSRQDRERLHGHKSFVLWFTGLSGSGKSTIAHQVEKRLYDQGLGADVLDGDNVRHGLCGDLSFTPEARAENLRRTAEVTKLFLDAGIICLTAFISPLRADRDRVRRIVGAEDFVEIYVSCPLEVCEPGKPAPRLETDKLDVEICVERVIEFVRARL
jgi:adenylylsulfate kinase